ncbi:mRNA splicing factor CWC22 (nucleomorph) [Lotharella oceanica]|uniref:mRNA splicing factor CWC22 n=1 Tax=Lotharella oceanica TaxID=641309 RepID=A0A060DHL7_9EUKA|nr:mRNA splicing factor CWC22 [Lotharella oceanica]
MKLYRLSNSIIYQTNSTNIENKFYILLSKNFYFIRKYLIYQILITYTENSKCSTTSIILLQYFNTFIPEIVEIILNYVLIQLKESYKKHNAFILKITVKFIVNLINNDILDDTIVHEFIHLLINQKTYFALYAYLLLKSEIIFMNNKNLKQKMLSKEIANISIMNKFVDFLIQKNIKYILDVHKIKTFHSTNNNKFLSLKFKFSLLDMLYTFKKDLSDDIKLKKKLLTEQYNFFIVLYIKNFMKSRKCNQKISSKKIQFSKKNQNCQLVSLTLKRKIYLIFMSSLSAKEAVLKLSKLNILEKNLNYIISILIECCIQEDKYLKYYSQIAEILCKISKILKRSVEIAFLETCKTIFRYKINKIKISGNFFGYLFSTGALSWGCLADMVITILHSNSSIRIFLKHILITIISILGKNFLKKILKDIIFNSIELQNYEKENIINLIYGGIFKDHDLYSNTNINCNDLLIS